MYLYFSWYRTVILRVFLTNYELIISALCKLRHSPEVSDEPGQAASTLSHPRHCSLDLHLLLTLDVPRGGEDIQSFHFTNVGVGRLTWFSLNRMEVSNFAQFSALISAEILPPPGTLELLCPVITVPRQNLFTPPFAQLGIWRSIKYITGLCAHITRSIGER
jgi:hypothetical protein